VRSDGKGKGTTLQLSLPAAPEHHADGARRADGAASLSRDTVQQRLLGVRALVIDDDPDARELLTTLLEGRGIRVRVAGSVREGVAALEREVPDIIFSDLAMPDQDGYELIRLLRQRSAEAGGTVPAIAVTAYARPEDATLSLSSGFQVHLTKPIDPAELFLAVERLAPKQSRRAQ
jgi:CheY-like chemotaxis protein